MSQAWTETAASCRSRLAALQAPTEAALLALGERLRQAHETTRSLSAMARALDHRLSEPDFQDTLKSLDGTIRLVQSLRGSHGGERGPLHDIADHAAAIRRALTTLQETMSHVHVLGMNGKIEAAQMADTGVDFSLFTHGVFRLAGRGRDAIGQAQGDLASLEAAVQQAESLQRDFAAEHARSLGEVAARLGQSLVAMRSRERQAQTALDRLPRVLEDAAGRIGAVVAGLQFGDISRQRLEHVDHALEVFAEVAAGRRPLPPEAENLGLFAAAVCELQARQLRDIGSEFSSETRRALASLGELTAAIEDIHQHTAAVYSSGHDGGSTFLLQVDRELQTVAAALAHYAEATTRTHQALDGVRGTAAAMTQAMRAIADVDADMNLIGLNASIKCGNLGPRGRALNVVAQELRAYARQTRGLAAQVAEKLEEVAAAADAVVAADNQDGESGLRGIQANLDTAVERLRQAGGETAWVLSQIQDQAAGIVAAVRQATGRFDAHQAYQTATEAAAAELDSLALAAAQGLDRARLEAVKHRLVDFMEVKYTMASERDVHFGRNPAAGGEMDLADVLF